MSDSQTPEPGPGPGPQPEAPSGAEQPSQQAYPQPYPPQYYGYYQGYQQPYQQPYQGWYAPAQEYLSGPPAYPGDERRTARLSGWTWPVISVLALVLGLAGGAVGGALVSDDPMGTGGGVLEVERRTAPPLPADNASIANVAAKVLPSTVQIIAEYKGRSQGATGSGWVFDKQGHVITNNHVVAEAAQDDGPIEVIDQDGRHLSAKVVGRSAVYDLAVLKVEGAESIPPAAIGSSEQMRVGEIVVAFGSPLGLSATVTSGIISALNRPVTTGSDDDSSYINAVQTDAAINPGNSGGPLTNLQGQVIGVNSAIASLGSSLTTDEGGNIGVGFAIPIEQVQVTTDQILRTGKAQYPIIGASIRGTEERDGARIQEITAGSPAEKAGLKEGDVITAVAGKPVTGSSDAVVAIRSHQPGEKVTLTVRRDGKERKVQIVLQGQTG